MHCWCIRDNNTEMIIQLYVSITAKIMCHHYLLRKEKWMGVVRRWFADILIGRYALPVSTFFNFKQYRGRNCRAICFFPPPYVRFTSSFIEFFVTVQRTLRARKHIDRERWDSKSPVCTWSQSQSVFQKREKRKWANASSAKKFTTNCCNTHKFGWTIAWLITHGQNYNFAE